MPSNETGPLALLNETFEEWTRDYRALGDFCHSLNNWMTGAVTRHEVDIQEVPKQLTEFQSRLQKHFQMERELGNLLAAARGHSTSEIDATRRQADKDHAVLCDRLQRLIDSATIDDGEYDDSGRKIVYEFNLIIDALEQHQELELENLRSLIPLSKASLDCN